MLRVVGGAVYVLSSDRATRDPDGGARCASSAFLRAT